MNSLSTAIPFCEQVWNSCSNITLNQSPFGSPGLLSAQWKTKTEFCQRFGGSAGDEGLCFPVALNDTQSSPPPKGVCLERLLNGSFINIVPHPDGSNRVFLSAQDGKIWLATVPEQGSGELLDIDLDNPFLDLTDVVFSSKEFGLLGMAFHPDFASNGRFFVSYNCDKSPSCSGRCSCNEEVNCDPSKLEKEASSQPCQYFSVIAEYSANGSSSPANVSGFFIVLLFKLRFKKKIFVTRRHPRTQLKLEEFSPWVFRSRQITEARSSLGQMMGTCTS